MQMDLGIRVNVLFIMVIVIINKRYRCRLAVRLQKVVSDGIEY